MSEVVVRRGEGFLELFFFFFLVGWKCGRPFLFLVCLSLSCLVFLYSFPKKKKKAKRKNMFRFHKKKTLLIIFSFFFAFFCFISNKPPFFPLPKSPRWKQSKLTSHCHCQINFKNPYLFRAFSNTKSTFSILLLVLLFFLLFFFLSFFLSSFFLFFLFFFFLFFLKNGR